MARIYRYSNTGFEPQIQTHLIKKSNTTLEKLHSHCDNDFLKSLISSSFKKPDPDFQYSGIFVFLKPPSVEDRNFYFNHLDKTLDKGAIQFFETEIDEESICYLDNGFVFHSDNKTSIKDALANGYETVYIPESELKNIQ